MTNVLLTIIYAIIGLVCISLSVFALRSNEQQAKVGTALFWSILGIIFIFGDWIPANIVGVLIIAMAVLSATKQVKVGSFKTSSEQFKLDSSISFSCVSIRHCTVYKFRILQCDWVKWNRGFNRDVLYF